MITINEKFSIKVDSNGAILKFQEPRMKPEVIDGEKTGNQVEYMFKDEFYYLNVQQCLRKALQLEIGEMEDVKTILQRINEVEALIKTIKL